MDKADVMQLALAGEPDSKTFRCPLGNCPLCHAVTPIVPIEISPFQGQHPPQHMDVSHHRALHGSWCTLT